LISTLTESETTTSILPTLLDPTTTVTDVSLSTEIVWGERTQTTAIKLDSTATVTAFSLVTEPSLIPTPNTLTEETSVTEGPTITKMEVQSDPVTTTATKILATGLTTTETASTTIIQTLTEISLSVEQRTVYVTATSVRIQTVTIALTQTFSSAVVVTITSHVAISESQSTAPTAVQQEELVLCTTRDVNPTFTPATPLPDIYTRGCPPGKLCQPQQDDCNFEQGVPALTYFCSPIECVNASEPPPPDFSETDLTCGTLYEPVHEYFNLNPSPFGLGYWIFDVDGQTARPCDTTTAAAVWRDWTLRERAHRDTPQRQQATAETPSACYITCNGCGYAAQNVALVLQLLCPGESAFKQTLRQCNDCIYKYQGGALPNSVPH
jgi:hypothetical protein